MAEIEITLPTVQYGNVKVRATPEELGLDSVGDAAALGVAAAVYLTTFSLGFKRGSAIDIDIDDSMAHSGSGPYKAVDALQAASQESQRTISQIMSDEDVDTVEEATAIFKRELGVTEIEEYDSAAEAREATQARTSGLNYHQNDGPEESDDAPWNNRVDAKRPPWETGDKAPVVPAELSDW